jgi:hypothetical protein
VLPKYDARHVRSVFERKPVAGTVSGEASLRLPRARAYESGVSEIDGTVKHGNADSLVPQSRVPEIGQPWDDRTYVLPRNVWAMSCGRRRPAPILAGSAALDDIVRTGCVKRIAA